MESDTSLDPLVAEVLNDIGKVHHTSKSNTNLITPMKDESLLSVIIRHAINYGLSLHDYLVSEIENLEKNSIFLFKFPRNWHWIKKADILPNQLLTNIIANYSLKVEELTLISQFEDLGIKLEEIRSLKSPKSKFALNYQFELRACPVCWQKASEIYFKKIWRLSCVLLCPEHHILLIKNCPNCLKPLFSPILSFTESWFKKCHHCGYEILKDS